MHHRVVAAVLLLSSLSFVIGDEEILSQDIVKARIEVCGNLSYTLFLKGNIIYQMGIYFQSCGG